MWKVILILIEMLLPLIVIGVIWNLLFGVNDYTDDYNMERRFWEWELDL
jgi:hypothetical protein